MDNEQTPYEALLACEKAAGSQSAMARDLGVSQPTVWRWLQSSKRMPAEYVLRAEGLYGVPRSSLRPDIYPLNLTAAAPSLSHGDMASDGNASSLLDTRTAA